MQARDAAAGLRSALSGIPTPVACVGVLSDAGPLSFIASTFVGVSLEPPIVSLSFQKTSSRWAMLRQCERVGITILARHHEFRARQLAGVGTDNYEGLSTVVGAHGEVFIADGVVGFACHLAQVVEAGDHDMALYVVDEIVAPDGSDPLVFHGSKFRRLATDQMTDANWLSLTEWH